MRKCTSSNGTAAKARQRTTQHDSQFRKDRFGSDYPVSADGGGQSNRLRLPGVIRMMICAYAELAQYLFADPIPYQQIASASLEQGGLELPSIGEESCKEKFRRLLRWAPALSVVD